MIKGTKFYPFDWDWVSDEDNVIITGKTEDEQIINMYIDKDRMNSAMKVWLKITKEKKK